ncbi:hypothetical protein KKG85_01960 [Patescibacteria group bacterium]|nr:hypothetical protein [Patescibacteria group bacterium]MBU2579421.1 hypothetical protein [Patescibacteria group bacterium]MBU4082543.1 hypothetical protein [Patescibacteria group bacterium]MCG2695360.1 hypothetical protein [Candidatus Parcubacteria bacterium]
MLFFPKDIDIIDKIQLTISYFIRLVLLLAVAESVIFQNWTVLFVSLLVLFITFLPALIQRNYKIHLPIELEFIVAVFVYAAIFLGEARNYYTKIWWWDIALHALSSTVIAFAGFLVLLILYQQYKIKASPITIAVFSFCFALSLGTIWEMMEFGADMMFGLNMQKSGLVDTMLDLMVNAGGALVISFFGYFYIRDKRFGFVGTVINRIAKKILTKNNIC